MRNNVIKIAFMLLVLALPTASFARASGSEIPITNSISTVGMFDSDVSTSGALDRAATEPLSGGSRDHSNTSLYPSDPRIGQNPRDIGGSISKVDRSDSNSVINRGRW
jgi:hypothetical protein